MENSMILMIFLNPSLILLLIFSSCCDQSMNPFFFFLIYIPAGHLPVVIKPIRSYLVRRFPITILGASLPKNKKKSTVKNSTEKKEYSKKRVY